MEELQDLAIEDPTVRRVLAESRLCRLKPEYGEPDLIISSTRALNSITDDRTHHLWSNFVLGGPFALTDSVLPIPSNLTRALKHSLKVSFLSRELV